MARTDQNLGVAIEFLRSTGVAHFRHVRSDRNRRFPSAKVVTNNAFRHTTWLLCPATLQFN